LVGQKNRPTHRLRTSSLFGERPFRKKQVNLMSSVLEKKGTLSRLFSRFILSKPFKIWRKPFLKISSAEGED